MAIPVNKQTLDTKINTDLANNSTQAITAAVLRDTLTPIVNSTFGLKTIWAGYIASQRRWVNSSGQDYVAIFVCERYYDPNYFPALDPNSLDTTIYNQAAYSAPGCRYKITNSGVNLVNGEFSNVETVIKNSTENTGNIGNGLTFDVKVEGGVLRAIKVKNTGSGYCWGRYGSQVSGLYQPSYKSTIVELVLNYTGIGNRPEITIDLSSVIDSDRRVATSGSNFGGQALNLFIPQAGPSIGLGSSIWLGSDGANGRTGNICTPDSSYNTYYPNVNNNPLVPGYYKSGFFTVGTDWALQGNNLEIKVPIINTTI